MTEQEIKRKFMESIDFEKKLVDSVLESGTCRMAENFYYRLEGVLKTAFEFGAITMDDRSKIHDQYRELVFSDPRSEV
ncbi:MAG: hypothetical protein UDG86_06100 [Lachnospiraceae bacterium]|jgi:hypothetical protein|nr:hypothetical protein [Lachnospiraceae bacterium]